MMVKNLIKLVYYEVILEYEDSKDQRQQPVKRRLELFSYVSYMLFVLVGYKYDTPGYFFPFDPVKIEEQIQFQNKSSLLKKNYWEVGCLKHCYFEGSLIRDDFGEFSFVNILQYKNLSAYL